jgi:hypothetical protein
VEWTGAEWSGGEGGCYSVFSIQYGYFSTSIVLNITRQKGAGGQRESPLDGFHAVQINRCPLTSLLNFGMKVLWVIIPAFQRREGQGMLEYVTAYSP